MLTLDQTSLEIICDHLDFDDLKSLSQTCTWIDYVSWTIRREICQIKIKDFIPEYQIDVLTNTKKEIKHIHFCNNGDILFPFLQIMELSCMHLANISISVNQLNSVKNHIGSYTDKINTITLNVMGEATSIQRTVALLRNEYSNFRMVVKYLYGIHNPMDPGELNADYFDVIQAFFMYGMRNAVVNQEVFNAPFLVVFRHVDDKILNFKCVKEMDLEYAYNCRNLLETLIESNKTTLLKLSIRYASIWQYELPCQLKEFSITNEETMRIGWVADFLRNQKSLRRMSLEKVYISDELIPIFREQKMLTELTIRDCRMWEDTDKLLVFSTIKKFNLSYVNIDLVNSAICNPDTLESLEIKRIFGNENNFILNSEYRKLKVFKIRESQSFCDHFCQRVTAPNLEYCTIPEFSESTFTFLKKCERLRDVRVTKKAISPIKEIFKLPQSIVNLEIFVGFIDFLRILPEIMVYPDTTKHFEITIVNENPQPECDIIVDAFIKPNWQRKFDGYYTCKKLSFRYTEINIAHPVPSSVPQI